MVACLTCPAKVTYLASEAAVPRKTQVRATLPTVQVATLPTAQVATRRMARLDS